MHIISFIYPIHYGLLQGSVLIYAHYILYIPTLHNTTIVTWMYLLMIRNSCLSLLSKLLIYKCVLNPTI